MAIDRTTMSYLKKRSEMTADFSDVKVQAALVKIVPPPIDMPDVAAAEPDGFDCIVPNKMFRNWIDLIPEKDRGFVRFVYVGGNGGDLERYLKTAMTAPAFETFRSLVSKDADGGDLFLMRYLIWHFAVLRRAVGFDFGNYEMNAIFNGLPMDVSGNKIKFGRDVLFADFYRMIWFAKWGLNNVD